MISATGHGSTRVNLSRSIATSHRWLLMFSVFMSACAQMPFPGVREDSQFPRYHIPDAHTAPGLQPVEWSIQDRMALPAPHISAADVEAVDLYSFVINNMPVKEGLRLFARAYKLNIVIDEDVTGILNVEFHDMTLQRALSVMLDNLDYYWQINDSIIRVRSQETRQLTLDYLRLVRSGTSSSTATVSSSSSNVGGSSSGSSSGSSGGSSSGSNQEAGSIIIAQSDEIRFWSELESQLVSLLGPSGSIVVNSLSGTVQVTDQHAFVQAVADYVAHINRAIHRQVDIEVKILEVVLSDTTALGVDWSRVTNVLDSGTNVDFSIGGIVTSPAGGIAPLASVLNLNAFNLSNDGDLKLQAVIQALAEQGEVEIISQPHVRTMNNQTSLIKVGTDRTFFRREQSTDSTSAGSITTTTDVPQVVTEGVVLSITPQIGERGWVMMDISPVVTRVSSVSVVEGPTGAIQSSAPNLDVSQVSTLIRAKSGTTVVLGGLIQTQTSDTRRGIPGLTNLGRFSNLFGGQYASTVRKELIMIITPTIVPSGD